MLSQAASRKQFHRISEQDEYPGGSCGRNKVQTEVRERHLSNRYVIANNEPLHPCTIQDSKIEDNGLESSTCQRVICAPCTVHCATQHCQARGVYSSEKVVSHPTQIIAAASNIYHLTCFYRSSAHPLPNHREEAISATPCPPA